MFTVWYIYGIWRCWEHRKKRFMKYIFAFLSYIIGVMWGLNSLINKALMGAPVWHGQYINLSDMFCLFNCAKRTAPLF